ncbi:sulfatase-like hydrolase/transferase [Patescibacteria group bacterium]|nr:sulfatase-like hydrolase/transferase [Patescibacteria group bacterium]
MKLKYLLFLLIFFIALIGLYYSTARKTSSPNLILISIDTLRPDHMSMYGYNRKTTPNIDSFAQDSFVFTNAYTEIPFTRPSFASLMTGISPFTSGIITNGIGPSIDSNTPTLAQILKENGYTTIAYVSNRFIGPKLSNLNKGFDEFHLFDAYGLWKRDTQREKYNNFFNQAISTIKKNKNKKMFIWIHLMDPHYPFFPPPSSVCNFNSNYCETLTIKSEIGLLKDINQYFACQNTSLNNDTLDLSKTLYDGDIKQADQIVGNVVNTLKNTKLLNKSIVMIYGDHGEGFDHDYYFTHGGVLYNSAVRIPLIIRDSSTTGHEVKIAQVIRNIDILPTVLQLLHIRINKLSIDGVNLSTLIRSNIFNKITRQINNNQILPIYFINTTGTKFAIFDGRYKYIYSLNNSCLYNNELEELYDEKTDPEEKNNIIKQHKQLANSLKNQLFDFISKYGYPKKDNSTEWNMSEDIIKKLKELGY